MIGVVDSNLTPINSPTIFTSLQILTILYTLSLCSKNINRSWLQASIMTIAQNIARNRENNKKIHYLPLIFFIQIVAPSLRYFSSLALVFLNWLVEKSCMRSDLRYKEIRKEYILHIKFFIFFFKTSSLKSTLAVLSWTRREEIERKRENERGKGVLYVCKRGQG